MAEWKPYKTKMVGYKSLKTGKVYPSGPGGYANHGYGGIKVVERKVEKTVVYDEYHDLPADEYPYTVVYEDPELSKPAWMK